MMRRRPAGIDRHTPLVKGQAKIWPLAALAVLLLMGGRAAAAPPAVFQTEVTDITPAAFAVTWFADQPTTGSLLLFQADCLTPVTPLTLTAEQHETTGFLRVTVSGLKADTGYCYQTVTTAPSTGETTLHPQQPASLTTAAAVSLVMTSGGKQVPFANDLLRVPPVHLPTIADSQEGRLVVLTLEGGVGKAPLSLLLTADPTKNYFNLNNLFDAASGTSLNLTGGERARISERHGRLACIIERFRLLPADGETTTAGDFLSPPRPQDIDADGTVNILDLLRVAAGAGSAAGDPCFNSDLDLSGDSRVDLQDALNAEGMFDATL